MSDMPSQDLIEVRLKRAAEVAPVRIVTDYAMSSTSTPIRSVMLEAAQELAALRAAVNALPELLALREEVGRLKSIANIAELMVNDYQSNSFESYQSWLEVLIACFETDPPAARALPELLAVKAERDRAQQACEQMGERITSLENSLREIGAAIINGASDTLWMGDQISDETVVDFICNLTGDDPSLLGTFARAALNQEPKP